MKFTHLHTHSHYSLLDGLAKVDQLLDRAKDLGMDSLALTDHGNLYGAVEFYKKAKERGIKPILGAELYLAFESMDQKRPKIDDTIYHLVVLVKNQEGYKNLVKILTQAHLRGFYYKPRVDEAFLKEHSSGLIALSGCLNGRIPRLLQAKKTKEAEETALRYQEIFGKGNFYLELQRHPNIPEQKTTNQGLLELSKKLGIPVVATADSHYLKPEDAEAQDILMLINTGSRPDDPERLTLTSDDFSMKSPKDMAELFSDIPEAVRNTQTIAEQCNLTLDIGVNRLPSYPLPDNKNADDYLKELCLAGLAEKQELALNPEAHKRLDFELGVIRQTGFAPYFLIVQDFVNWAKEKRIVVGPGRGSVGGSLVAYVLKITNINPLQHNLLFERFLNPERVSLPDIDLDFADYRRDEVIQYVAQKYGQDRVAQIITFGTMAARAVVRDVGRALGYEYGFCDRVAKMIPFSFSLQQTLEKVAEFKEAYDTDERAKRLIDLAKKLEGVARHASTHACGVVIAAQPLDSVVPLQHPTQNDEHIVTQYEMHSIEDLGLLKMDFLGLKNLSVIEDTLRRIYAIYGKSIDIDRISQDDPKAYKLFQEGNTVGVFQVECLSGDTIISNMTIKDLYERRDKKTLESVYLDEGKVHRTPIIGVYKSGKKQLYTLITENNRYIKASQDHQFLTQDGWKKLSEIQIGDRVLIKHKAKYAAYQRCTICGVQLNGWNGFENTFCYRCSATFYSNPSKPLSREANRQSVLTMYRNGRVTWNKGMNKNTNDIIPQTAKKISTALLGKTWLDWYDAETIARMRAAASKRMRGENNHMFGKRSPHRKGGFREDLGHYVRSNWEADFARILQYQGLAYEYEPKTFLLKRENGEILHYTPDFYVPTQNTYYEIKGWMHELDQEKIDLFRKYYPQFPLVVISATKFAEFALQYKELIAWECPRVPYEKNFGFVGVKEICKAGIEEVYDISMQDPGNNFVANSFVVHNSGGMQRYLKELKPTEFEDIIAMIALYRPGPMELIPEYIARKRGRRKIVYIHEKLKPILETTQGICLYQEQLMKIAQDLAGFSLAEADVLRKAVGKKIKSLLEQQQEKFVSGMVKNGIEKRIASQLWEWVLPFARYGFNKCVTGDTKIMDSKSGRLVRIADVFAKKVVISQTPSLTEHLRAESRPVVAVKANGITQVFEVRTRSGRTIETTLNHPFLTWQGWKNLEDICEGEWVAVPRKLPEPEEPMQVPTHKVEALGYLLAEGNFCHPHGFYFYSTSQEEVDDYLHCLRKFANTDGSIDASKNATAVLARRVNLQKPSEAVEWITSLGLKHKKAPQKFIPDFVYQLSNNQLAILIGKMFQGDGCIHFDGVDAQVFYATSSHQVARGLLHLFLRFGILSTIHTKKFRYRGGYKIGYTVNISRYDNLQKFIRHIAPHLLEDKWRVIQKIQEIYPHTLEVLPARGSKDIIPAPLVRPLVRAAAHDAQLTYREAGNIGGFSERLFMSDPRKVGYLRETVAHIAATLHNKQLKRYAESDIFWDKVLSINSHGKKETYDLTIKDTHNFVANDVFVHNSHSAAYATIAYQTAWLKTYYPVEFMSALLTAERNDIERIAFLIEETKKMGIEVLPPDVNESFSHFSVVPQKNQIRFGLLAIKNVGQGIVETIIGERKKSGPFLGMHDFISRVSSATLNKKSLESLIKAGVFDHFADRNKLLFNLERLLQAARESFKLQNGVQQSLFVKGTQTLAQFPLQDTELTSENQKLLWEKELLGLYVSSHPLQNVKNLLEKKAFSIAKILRETPAGAIPRNQAPRIRIGGIISSIKRIITKTGKPMLFLGLEDLTSKIEVVVFPSVIEKYPTAFQENKIVLVAGKPDTYHGTRKFIAEEIEEMIVV